MGLDLTDQPKCFTNTGWWEYTSLTEIFNTKRCSLSSGPGTVMGTRDGPYSQGTCGLLRETDAIRHCWMLNKEGLGCYKNTVWSHLNPFCCCRYLATQLWTIPHDPMDCSLPGSAVHWISQAMILEWVAISFSGGSSQSKDWTCASCIARWILYHWDTWEALRKSYTGHKDFWGCVEECEISPHSKY